MWLKVILLLHVVLAWRKPLPQPVSFSFQSVEAGAGGVFAVDKQNRIVRVDVKRQRFMRYPGLMKQISVGSREIWGVNKANEIYKLVPKSRWRRITGFLKHVSVSDNHRVWGVNKDNAIYRRARAKQIWIKIDGVLKQISVGRAGVWGVNPNGDVFYRQGTFGDKDVSGTDWVRVPGKLLKWISSGRRVFGVTSKNEIYERTGLSDQYPTGQCWMKRAGSLSQISVGPQKLWGIGIQRSHIYNS